MTGQRPGRGAPGDPWRGGRPGSSAPERRPVYRPDSHAGPAELEELPAQQVLGRGSSGLGATGILAIVAIVALLATGFGFLGGRPEATGSPSATRAAAAPTPGLRTPARPTPLIVGPVGPAVTPWAPCSPPTAPPSFVLETRGQTYPGTITALLGPGGVPIPMPTSARAETAGPSIQIQPESVVELWSVGGRCALAWTLAIVGEGIFDEVENPENDPEWIAQNRFSLQLVPWEGRQVELIGTFAFAELRVRVSWALEVLPLARPAPRLADDDGDGIPLLGGCDVYLVLQNGWEEAPNPCDESLPEQPGEASRIDPGEELTFAMPGWRVSGVTMACGQLGGLAFVPAPDDPCASAPDEPGLEPLVFEALREPGEWILAISACGETAAGAANACGTWYAALDVRD